MEGSSSVRREARARRQRCSACDLGGNLHPCRGCGLAFHADIACSGRRASRHTGGGGSNNLAPGAALLCASCSNAQCSSCHLRVGSGSSSSSNSSGGSGSAGLETFAAGCHAASGGCGRVFHTACLATNSDLPCSAEAVDTWRCAYCSPPLEAVAMDSDSEGNRSADNTAPAARRSSRDKGRNKEHHPLSPTVEGRKTSRSARTRGGHSSHSGNSLQPRTSNLRHPITTSITNSPQLSVLARVPRRKGGRISSDENDEDADFGPGIPSDESDDWDSKCKKCGTFGNLVCCDNCPGGKCACGKVRNKKSTVQHARYSLY